MRLGKVTAGLLSRWRRRRAPAVGRVHAHERAHTPVHTPGAGGEGEENRSECLKIERQPGGALDSRIGGRPRARAGRTRGAQVSTLAARARRGGVAADAPRLALAPGPAGSAR